MEQQQNEQAIVIEVKKPIVTLEAVVIRKDGTREDLGVIARSAPEPTTQPDPVADSTEGAGNGDR